MAGRPLSEKTCILFAKFALSFGLWFVSRMSGRWACSRTSASEDNDEAVARSLSPVRRFRIHVTDEVGQGGVARADHWQSDGNFRLTGGRGRESAERQRDEVNPM